MPTRDTYQLLELDFELLRDLPVEGAKMGLSPLGTTVKALRRNDKYEGLGPDQLGARLRNLRDMGLVVGVTVLPVSAGLGWQRTQKGTDRLDEFDRRNGGESS
jgi:hypothetical protein